MKGAAMQSVLSIRCRKVSLSSLIGDFVFSLKGLRIIVGSILIMTSCLLIGVKNILADQITVGAMPIGTVVSFGGIRWIKIDSENTFMAIDLFPAPAPTVSIYMQSITKDYCNSMAELDTLTLIDKRDGKFYRIRKFADGNCWMIDNLKYGGDTDIIAGKTSFSGNGQTTPYTAWYSGGIQLYGDARDPSVGTGSDYCATGAGAGKCGYLYNWQAAMQNSSAYQGADYTGSANNDGSGICPSPWQLPPNSGANSFYNLHTTYGSPSPTNFWVNDYYWDGVYASFCNYISDLYNLDRGYYWASNQFDINGAHHLFFLTDGNVYPQYHNYKNSGFSVRCVL